MRGQQSAKGDTVVLSIARNESLTCEDNLGAARDRQLLQGHLAG